MADRPNVVFITCDQLRGDCLGIYGHPVVETPHLDQLARNGALFTGAYSAVPSCIAARAAMLTGMKQENHGRVGYMDGVRFDYENTLPGELAKAGYHTQGVGKMHFSPARNLCGFHNVVLHDGYIHHEKRARKNYEMVDDYVKDLKRYAGEDSDIILHGLNSNSWVARPWPYDESIHPTTWATTQGIDFLRRRDPTKPFFMWLSYVRPHPPLDPPRDYFDQYINQDFPEVFMGDWADTEAIAETVDGIGYMGKRQLHRARAAYYAQITHIDHQIGRLLEHLYEHDLWENTVIVFTSDHGEMLGDHNLFRKCIPYLGSAKVPFFISPLRSGFIEGRQTVDKLVELRDVMPTILDICGVDIPDSVDGESVLPFCRKENPPWRDYIHGEHPTGNLSNHYIVTKNYKYIWFTQDGREQFFDIGNDPGEYQNKIDDPDFQDKVSELRNILIKELEGREEGYTDGEKLIAEKPPKSVLDFLFERTGTPER